SGRPRPRRAHERRGDERTVGPRPAATGRDQPRGATEPVTDVRLDRGPRAAAPLVVPEWLIRRADELPGPRAPRRSSVPRELLARPVRRDRHERETPRARRRGRPPPRAPRNTPRRP